MASTFAKHSPNMSSLAGWILCLGLAGACADTTPNSAAATGGTSSTGGAVSVAGATAQAGALATAGASGMGTARICYTEPRDPAAGGAISVFELYPEKLCYSPGTTVATAGAGNVAAAGTAGGSTCPAITDSSLQQALGEANPQSLSSIWIEWIIDGPIEPDGTGTCCYNACMSFNGA